jgi:hypothetical protein
MTEHTGQRSITHSRPRVIAVQPRMSDFNGQVTRCHAQVAIDRTEGRPNSPRQRQVHAPPHANRQRPDASIVTSTHVSGQVHRRSRPPKHRSDVLGSPRPDAQQRQVTTTFSQSLASPYVILNQTWPLHVRSQSDPTSGHSTNRSRARLLHFINDRTHRTCVQSHREQRPITV